MLKVERIRPLRNRVLIEAETSERTESGLFLPIEGEVRFPELGRVVAVGQTEEDIRVGDFVVVPNEGIATDLNYWQATFLQLLGLNEIVYCSAEIEPVVRDAVNRWKREPSAKDFNILVETIDGDKVKFNCSDVLDFGLCNLTDPGVKLEYLPVVTIRFLDEGLERLFYFAEVKQIILTLRAE